MNSKNVSIEVQATTVEEAIEHGLAELNVKREEVKVDILEPGSRGLFGLGSREALVRLTYIRPGQTILPDPEKKTAPTQATAAPAEPESDPEPLAPEDAEELTADVSEPATPTTADSSDTIHIVEETIRDLLGRMYINAEVSAKINEEDNKKQNIWVDINGDDLNVLIGRRSETVNALQYITQLIVGKELGRSVSLTIDVAGYRTRRENQLRSLARRMARQAEETGKTQFLEPMPANERRIIHIELRNHPKVITQSMGEGNRRKVTIILKS